MNPIDRLNAINEENVIPKVKVEQENQIFKTVHRNGIIAYLNNKQQLHNINDLPAIIYPNGNKFWCKNGMLHRDKLPAVILADGYKAWYINNELIKHEEKD